MIGHVLTVDIIGLVQKMEGGIQKHLLLKRALPSLFSSFPLFSLSLPPPLFAPATQARLRGAKTVQLPVTFSMSCQIFKSILFPSLKNIQEDLPKKNVLFYVGISLVSIK